MICIVLDMLLFFLLITMKLVIFLFFFLMTLLQSCFHDSMFFQSFFMITQSLYDLEGTRGMLS